MRKRLGILIHAIGKFEAMDRAKKHSEQPARGQLEVKLFGKLTRKFSASSTKNAIENDENPMTFLTSRRELLSLIAWKITPHDGSCGACAW